MTCQSNCWAWLAERVAMREPVDWEMMCPACLTVVDQMVAGPGVG